MKKALTILGMLVLIGAMLAPCVTAVTPWWNDDWEYRMTYTITNGGSQANTIVRIDLNSTTGGFNASNAKADGTDIRFVKNNQIHTLVQFREYYNQTLEQGGTFHILYPSLPVGDTTIWVYYGNPSAGDQSNGSAVFTNFDTFSGTDYTNRLETPTVGPVDNATIYEKNAVVRFQPDGSTYWYEENTTMMGISMAYHDEPLVRATYDHYLAYGSLWNDSSNYSICAAYSDNGYSGWSRFTNNPIVNISYGDDLPDSLKCTEPDWMHNITHDYRKDLHIDTTYNYTLYYTSLNSTRYGICAVNSTTSLNPDCAWTKQGIMLDAVDVTWASEVRKPVVWCQGETDFRMLFAGLDGTIWKIGYATAAGVLGPWSDTGYPVLNTTSGTHAWDNASVIPCDVWGNGTRTWVSYAGMDSNNDWRQGIAYCDDSDPLEDWTKYVGHVSFGNAYRSLTDADDCQYGSWNIIPGTGALYYFHSMKNATHTSMGDAVALNTSWINHGTAQSVYNLWDPDGDGETGLYVDTNETYLLNDFNGTYEEGGAAYHNYSVTVDCWARGTDQADNVSVIARAGDAAWGSRSHYATELNITGSAVTTVLSLAGTETQVNTSSLADTFSENGDQVQLNIRCLGGEMYSYVENMPDNYTGEANGSNAQHINGMVGILAHNCPTEFDYFRIAGYSGASITTAAGATEQDYDSWSDQQEAETGDSGAGGGGVSAPPDPDYPMPDDTNDTDEGDGGSTCWTILGPLAACIGTGGIGYWKRRLNKNPRK